MTEPVRIAFVITELDVGGAERCLANLAAGIDRTRFAPLVAPAPRPASGQDSLVRQLEAAPVPVHFLNLRSSASFLAGLGKLKRFLRQHEIEVVQTFLFHANVLGALAARSAGVRQIVSGIRVADPTRWRMAVERFALRRVDKIVCVSQAVADFAATEARFPRSKLHVIANGIDLTPAEADAARIRSELGIARERRILLGVGRLHRQKGFDWLLERMPELFKRLPGHDLVIAGDGPERKSLGELASSLGVQDRVRFTGWRNDVAELMQAADIFLLSSRWEGMPNALIEAMGWGLPVVATSVEGVKEVLGPRAAGQAVSPGDGKAFVDAVCRIALDPDYGVQLGRGNRERIQAEFSLRAMIAQYEQVYLTTDLRRP